MLILKVPELVSAGGEEAFAKANNLDLTAAQIRGDPSVSRRAVQFAKLKPLLLDSEKKQLAKNERLEVCSWKTFGNCV